MLWSKARRGPSVVGIISDFGGEDSVPNVQFNSLSGFQW